MNWKDSETLTVIGLALTAAISTVLLGLWLLKRSRDSVNWLNENYTYSLDLSPEKIIIPQFEGPDITLQWDVLTRFHSNVYFHKYRGAPSDFRMVFDYKTDSEEKRVTVRQEYIPADVLKQAAVYIREHGPRDLIFSDTLLWWQNL